MKRHIRLNDLRHVPFTHNCATPIADRYSAEHVATSRADAERRGLRLDNATGSIFDQNGNVSRLVNPRDWEPLTTAGDVLAFAFGPQIANGASRLSRGIRVHG